VSPSSCALTVFVLRTTDGRSFPPRFGEGGEGASGERNGCRWPSLTSPASGEGTLWPPVCSAPHHITPPAWPVAGTEAARDEDNDRRDCDQMTARRRDQPGAKNGQVGSRSRMSAVIGRGRTLCRRPGVTQTTNCSTSVANTRWRAATTARHCPQQIDVMCVAVRRARSQKIRMPSSRRPNS